MENLRRRAEIIRQIRAFFDVRGFVEVTTPVLIAAPAPEPHIDCPNCGKGFLRASPELQMKKLLAAGMDKIYQIGPCFREGEFGTRHHPEFTMLEWYRLGVDYRAIYAEMMELMKTLFSPEDCGTPQTKTIAELYQELAGWNPFAEFDQDRFDYDMATKIEPGLPHGFCSLWDYPKEAASLAKISSKPSKPSSFLIPPSSFSPYAERWELYYNGIELANCFTELCDGVQQRERFVAARAERARLGESDYPLDEEFLELVPLMKSASGVALGVDRLVAALCGENDIHSVMAGE